MTNEQRNELAAALVARADIHGRFVLRSGQVADRYFDKYRFESYPALLRSICEAMIELLPPDADVLAGIELGGIPIAAVLSQLTGIPAVFVRKSRKTYGTCNIIEGRDVTGRRVVLVEDVVSGGQVAASAEELRGAGAGVDRAVCVVNRASRQPEALAAVGVELLAVFDASALPEPETA